MAQHFYLLNKAPLPVQKEYPELLVSQYLSIQAYLIQPYEAFRMNRTTVYTYIYFCVCILTRTTLYIYVCMCTYTSTHIYIAFMVETKQLAKLTHEVGLNHKPFKGSRLFSQFSAKTFIVRYNEHSLHRLIRITSK